jgi:hypothetical protein
VAVLRVAVPPALHVLVARDLLHALAAALVRVDIDARRAAEEAVALAEAAPVGDRSDSACVWN